MRLELAVTVRGAVCGGVARCPGALGQARSGEAVCLMDMAAGHSERGVVLPDGVLVRPVEQAAHLPVGVVVQLGLADAEPVGPGVATSSAICARASAGSFRSS